MDGPEAQAPARASGGPRRDRLGKPRSAAAFAGRGRANAGAHGGGLRRQRTLRFNRLSFLAFGPFTGLSLDLSGGAPGGFHLVFGPNEAGKSSALRGVHDLLFGFPERTPDAHVHPNAELRIAAALSSDSGQVVELQRLKRRKDALRNALDAPIDEGVLSSLLGGVDAQLFERLFGLDHVRLQRAGDALLEDRGDVGESLFDAGSGGRGIRGVLASLQQSADEIFKPRSSKA